ncbi:MAG: U2 snRNP complex subunit [Alyxoria varia]|nr:MAG: U2 snRNP complex subunit [Alyxoria varia]
MRLTADLINSSLSYLNPLKERELDLRESFSLQTSGTLPGAGFVLGHKIPAIENLGLAKDHDAIDLTDNDIPAITNFPLCPRLRTLLLARNRVTAISPTLHNTIPNLSTLVLEGNRLAELSDLDALGNLPRLVHLVLVGNPACLKENYRYWVLFRCPYVRFLDYNKVKMVERERATELFGTGDSPTDLAIKISNTKSRASTTSNTFEVPSHISGAKTSSGNVDKAARVKLTDKERKRVEEMIRNAGSLEEIARLEKELGEGRVPGGVVAE